jgi:DNA-binding response OmpR family regulator
MKMAMAPLALEDRPIPLPDAQADLNRFEVRYPGGECCRLSQREADLLRYLVRHAGRTISRDELLWEVWRLNPRCTITRTIDMHIAHLRDKLRDDAANPRVLFSVYGQGYQFAAGERLMRKGEVRGEERGAGGACRVMAGG